MPSTLHIVLAAAGVAAGLAGLLRHPRDRNHIAQLQSKATSAFRQTVVTAANPQFSFDGNEATVLRREETGGMRGIFERTADFAVTIYAENPQGEQFAFKWFSKSPKPFIKHLPRGRIDEGGAS